MSGQRSGEPIRVELDDYQAAVLAALAHDNGRTLDAEVQHILQEYLAALGLAGPPVGTPAEKATRKQT
jgi:hypothetical protein